MRGFRRSVVLIAVGLAAGLAPAAAQFGGIFGAPPRPPANVPSRPPADDRFIDQRGPSRQSPQYPPPAPQAYPPPPADYPPPASDYQPQPPQYQPAPPSQDAAAAAPGGIQSQSLPPVPGAPVSPAAAPAAALPGPPGGGPPAIAARPPGAPTDTTVQPGDEVVITPPAQKIINPTAVFRGLDKITGRITSFDVAINETVQFGALQVTPRVCYTRPPTELANTDSFVEVDEVTLQGEVKRIFTGWMFAASPGLHAVEHPIYDVWLTDCKGGGPPPAPVAEVQQPRTSARPAAPRAPARAAPRPTGPPR